jgi:hypothetical protein
MLLSAAVTWLYPLLLAAPATLILLWTGLSVVYKAIWLRVRSRGGDEQ